MTINYADSFPRALLQWRGSIYKAVFYETIVWHVFYFAILCVQILAFDEEDKIRFGMYIVQFQRGCGYIPLTFLLGFFVSGVVARWWQQFNYISWPDKLMLHLSLSFPGEKNAEFRRTMQRWANLQAVIAWRFLSIRTKKRFPSEYHYVHSGLMAPEELELYESIDGPYGKWFIPTLWMSNLLSKKHKEGVISSVQLKLCFGPLMSYRDGFAMLMVYDWINIPLVVAIAAYGYFILALIARQPLLTADSNDPYWMSFLPIYTTLQIMFYLGWLKVGQYLMHPFGEDEDDFELNWILDRNAKVGHIIGSETTDQLPDRIEEQFLSMIPHTAASLKIKDIPPRDPWRKLKIAEDLQAYMTCEEEHERIQRGERKDQSVKDWMMRKRPSSTDLARKHSVATRLTPTPASDPDFLSVPPPPEQNRDDSSYHHDEFRSSTSSESGGEMFTMSPSKVVKFTVPGKR